MSGMSLVEDGERTARPVRRQRLVSLGILTVSVLVVLVAPFLDSERVDGRSDQERVELGIPLAWVHQDQTSLDPPFPAQAELVSPWENPTEISWLVLSGDVVLVFGAALLVWLAASSAVRRRPSRRV